MRLPCRPAGWLCALILALSCGFTQAAVVITSGLNRNFSEGNNQDVFVDIDGNGQNDLVFNPLGSVGANVYVIGTTTEIQVYDMPPPDTGALAWPFDAMMAIYDDPDAPAVWFHNGYGALFRRCFDVGCGGLWPGNGVYSFEPFTAYLAIRLQQPDGWHYAWMEVAVQGALDSGFIRSYGYETLPNVPILAGGPEPGRGILLFLGACSLAFRRRR